jgi:hypothetical protein
MMIIYYFIELIVINDERDSAPCQWKQPRHARHTYQATYQKGNTAHSVRVKTCV